MKLSISNIAWRLENDNLIYLMMKKNGFIGLEIAPTRVFPNNPYDQLKKAKVWKDSLLNKYGLSVSSMQSIWFGKIERLFANAEERASLIRYTKQAIDFAEAIECKNLVFGCPKNRTVPENMSYSTANSIAVEFFKEIGDYAASHNTVIGMEANPVIYNTNFINDTASALKLIDEVDSDGFRLNLDVGTMIYNNEPVDVLNDKVHLINHVHISEPYLKPVQERVLHKELIHLLSSAGYKGFVSIEMGKVENIGTMENIMTYVKGLAD